MTHQLRRSAFMIVRENGPSKMLPTMALDRILVVRRFACPTNWWASCLNISETIRASNFQIAHNVAQDSLYPSTRNDVIIYVRSAANRTKCSRWVMFGWRFFSMTLEPILKKFTVLEIVIQWLHFLLCNLLDIFAP